MLMVRLVLRGSRRESGAAAAIEVGVRAVELNGLHEIREKRERGSQLHGQKTSRILICECGPTHQNVLHGDRGVVLAAGARRRRSHRPVETRSSRMAGRFQRLRSAAGRRRGRMHR